MILPKMAINSATISLTKVKQQNINLGLKNSDSLSIDCMSPTDINHNYISKEVKGYTWLECQSRLGTGSHQNSARKDSESNVVNYHMNFSA